MTRRQAVVPLLATLVVVASMAGVGSAHAAGFSGSGLDPDDAPRGKPDLERLSIGYDDSAGVITVTYKFHERAWQPLSLYLRFGLSKPGQGGCLLDPQEPDLDFRAAGDFESGAGIGGYADLNARTGSTRRLFTGPADEGRVTFSYKLPGINEDYTPAPPAPELVRAGYRCVTRVFADSDSHVEDGDQITKFCLGSDDCFQRATTTPAPTQRRTPTPRPTPTSTAVAPQFPLFEARRGSASKLLSDLPIF